MPNTNLGRLLIVDDEIELLNSLAEKLVKQGYETVRFSSPREALQALADQHFDLLLTDLMMPEMDGIALLQAARRIDPYLASIVMTGQATVQTAVDAMKMGAVDYILKPFKINGILPALARALEMRRLRLENIQLRETVGIYELCNAISFTLDYQILLNKIADAAMQQCEAEEASIMIPTDKEDQLRVGAVRGENRGHLLGECIPMEQGIAGWVARHRQPVTIAGEVNDPRFVPVQPRVDIRCAISMPMLAGGKLIGVLNVNSISRRSPFTMGQVKSLSILASTGAAALESAKLFIELQKAEQSLREQLRLASFTAEVGQAFIRAANLQEALQGCTDAMERHFDGAFGRIWLLNTADNMLELQASAGMYNHLDGPHSRIPVGQFKIGRIAESRLPHLTNEVLKDSNVSEQDWAVRERMVAFAGYPLLVGGELLGVMALFARRPLTEFTLKALEAAAAQIALGITRSQSEDALRRSEQSYRHLIDTAPDVICTISRDGTISSLNAPFETIHGGSPAEWIGKSIYDLLHPEDLAKGKMKFSQVLHGESVPAFQVRSPTKSGKHLDVEITTSPQIRNDKTVGILAIFRDITERKQLEAKFQQAQKMEAFGQLAGGVAHDFNNLLTVINGYSEMLLSELRDHKSAYNLLREIHKAGERAVSLTRQLLAFSRKQVLAPVVLNLNGVVNDMEKMLRRLIGEDINLVTHLESNLGLVKADPGQIEQVLLNLAVNARDAMPTGGHLTIETHNVDLDQSYVATHPEVRPGSYVMLAVSDNGCGMSEETKARIFEPFFTTKEVGKGTGLGLATVFGIVKQSEGHIAVYSEMDLGTTFKVYLPKEQSGVSPKHSQSGVLLFPGGTETVLLVEDEAAVRGLACLALESKGFKVLSAQDGREALMISQKHDGPIHMLVTDVVMPGMSGRELVEQIGPARPQMKVLYISGYTDDAIVRHGVLDAEKNFLQKPFTPMSLARKVRDVLDGKVVSNST